MKQIGVTTEGMPIVAMSVESVRRIQDALSRTQIALTAAAQAQIDLDKELTLASATPGPIHQEAAGPKRTERVTQKRTTPAKPSGRVCATRPASGETRVCIGCGQTFTPHRKDQRRCSKKCPGKGAAKAPDGKPVCDICGKPFKGHAKAKTCQDKKCQQQKKRQYQATWAAKRANSNMPPVPGRPPASAPEADDAKAKRLAAIRAADSRLKAKGTVEHFAAFDSDSGIRQANADDIDSLQCSQSDEN